MIPSSFRSFRRGRWASSRSFLSYRHIYHAGNSADVLKHSIYIATLQHLNAKATAYRIIDTHAGSGWYDLLDDHALQHSEYREAAGKFLELEQMGVNNSIPQMVAEYVALVRTFNGNGPLVRYPGSPAIAQHLSRPRDSLRFYELHPVDQSRLSFALEKDHRAKVFQKDGFTGLMAELPPPSRRGVVLIDPSYEIEADYEKVSHNSGPHEREGYRFVAA